MNPYWLSLAGGLLIGLSAVMLLLLNGRIAGISGMLGQTLQNRAPFEHVCFLLGLLLGPLAFVAIFGDLPQVRVAAPWGLIAVAGLLVGFGTRMGSGCTSGHGILGLARFSPRSLAATAMFMVAGIVTATLVGVFR